MSYFFQGDCIEGMRASVRNESVHLAFADPPFNIGFDYDQYEDKRPAAEYTAWCREWMTEIFRVLHPYGTFWLAIGPAFVSELDMLAKSLGFRKRSHVIWYYTFGVNCAQKFTPSHTHLIYYTKHRTNFTFNETQIRVPSARQLVYNDKRANPNGRLPDDTWILRPQDLPDGFPAEGDIWHIPRIAGTFKQRANNATTQMPEQLLGRIIRACSNEGDVVLDPMCGTATTLVVAKKLGREYLGFELSPAYAERSQQRIDAAKLGDPLDGLPPQGG